MIGCYDVPDKCSVVVKDQKYGGYSLLICRLKPGGEYEWGERTRKEDVGKVAAHLHFCKLEAAKAFLKAVQYMVDTWEQENDNAGNV